MTKQEAQAWGESHPVGTVVQPLLFGNSMTPAEVMSLPMEISGRWCVLLWKDLIPWYIENIKDLPDSDVRRNPLFMRVRASTESARSDLKRLAQSEWERLKGIVINRIERSAEVGRGRLMVVPSSDHDWGVHRIHDSITDKLVVDPALWWDTVRATPEFKGMTVVPRGWPTFEVYWADEPPAKTPEFSTHSTLIAGRTP